MIDIQRGMIKGAQKVIFCLDHTKLGRKSLLPLCEVDCIDTLVTDNGAAPDVIESFRARQIEVVVAPVGNGTI